MTVPDYLNLLSHILNDIWWTDTTKHILNIWMNTLLRQPNLM